MNVQATEDAAPTLPGKPSISTMASPGAAVIDYDVSDFEEALSAWVPGGHRSRMRERRKGNDFGASLLAFQRDLQRQRVAPGVGDDHHYTIVNLIIPEQGPA